MGCRILIDKMDVQEALDEFFELMHDVRDGNVRWLMWRERRLHALGDFLTLHHPLFSAVK